MKIIVFQEIRSFFHENETKMTLKWSFYEPKTTKTRIYVTLLFLEVFVHFKSKSNKKWIHFYHALTTKT